MNTKTLSVLLVASIGIVSCDKIAPPAENSAAGQTAPAVTTDTTAATAPAPFAPQLLTAPIMNVYMPDFSYSVRSRTDGAETQGGKASVAIEFWGVTVDEAEKRVRGSLVSSGYEVKSENSENGAYTARYTRQGASDEVLVNVSPIGPRKRTAPGSVGTIYFEWKN